MKGEHSRDRAIEQLLRESRRDMAASQPCMDADALAAWSDGTLSAAEARSIEAHASACDRCQSMLAAFARAAPAPAAPAEPFWHRWRLQWLAPAAAMATALAVWVAVPRDRPISTMRTTAALEERSTPGATDSGAGAAGIDRSGPTSALTMPPAGGQQGQSAPSPPRQATQADGQAGGRVDREVTRNAAGRLEADSKRESARGRQQEVGGVARDSAAGVAPIEPPGQIGSAAAAGDSAGRPTSQKSAAADPGRALSDALLPPVAVPRPPAPVSPPAAEAAAAPAPRLSFERMNARSAASPLDVASPDAVHRWRIDSAGQLQHSSTKGTDWQSVTLTTPDVLTAGVSPAGSVCWLVGRNGAVWVTSNGLQFDRRPVPEPVNLISVSARDARGATVGTADGRTFVTIDGGVTWTRAAP